LSSRSPWRSPYPPVLRHPVLRPLLPAMALSAVGDGMSYLAVSWLAMQLAPAGSAAIWVGICSAAAVLPGVAVALARPGAFGAASAFAVARGNALLHAVALAAVPLASWAGVLDVRVLAVLIGLSAPLAVWGAAARSTIIATTLPDPHRVAGNATVSALAQVGILAGPPLAGLLIAATGAVSVLAVDAVTFAVLALAYARAARRTPAPTEAARTTPQRDTAPTTTDPAWWVLRQPAVAAAIALTAAFYAIFGPVEVALPVHIAHDLHGAPGTLAAFVTVSGIGALLGGFAGGYLSRWPPAKLIPPIVIGWGACLLPLGLGAPMEVAIAAFGCGSFLYGPYPTMINTIVQRATPPHLLPRALSTQAAVVQLAVPLGAVAGAPLVATIGTQAA
jgi:DHA3 family macrolide efflux protein-like MFS transporter